MLRSALSVLILTLFLMSASQCSRQISKKESLSYDRDQYRNRVLPFFRSAYPGKKAGSAASMVFEEEYALNPALRDSAARILEKYQHPVSLANTYFSAAAGHLQDSQLLETNIRFLERAMDLSSRQAFIDSIETRTRAAGTLHPTPDSEYLRLKSAYFRLYASYLLQVGQPDDALSVLDRIMNKYHDADVYCDRADILEALHRYEEALQSRMHALTLTPFDPSIAIAAEKNALELTYSASAAATLLNSRIEEGRARILQMITPPGESRNSPSFRFLDTNGEVKQFSAAASPTVMLFWTMDDEDYSQLLTQFHKGAEASGGDPVFLSLNTDRNSSRVRNRADSPPSMVHLLAGPESPAVFGLAGSPALLVVDSSGRIRFTRIGLRPGELLPLVEFVLHSMKTPV